jgi:hypothetical protein
MGLHIFQRNFVTANEGAQPLQQYPNQTYFTTGTAWVKTDLETVYNGKLAIKRGSTVILESFSTRNFREVADTQQSAAGNYSSSSVDSGMVQLVPAFDLPGREQVSIQATFPTFTGILWQHDLANTENRIALVLQGFLVKGANI